MPSRGSKVLEKLDWREACQRVPFIASFQCHKYVGMKPAPWLFEEDDGLSDEHITSNALRYMPDVCTDRHSESFAFSLYRPLTCPKEEQVRSETTFFIERKIRNTMKHKLLCGGFPKTHSNPENLEGFDTGEAVAQVWPMHGRCLSGKEELPNRNLKGKQNGDMSGVLGGRCEGRTMDGWIDIYGYILFGYSMWFYETMLLVGPDTFGQGCWWLVAVTCQESQHSPWSRMALVVCFLDRSRSEL